MSAGSKDHWQHQAGVTHVNSCGPIEAASVLGQFARLAVAL